MLHAACSETSLLPRSLEEGVLVQFLLQSRSLTWLAAQQAPTRGLLHHSGGLARGTHKRGCEILFLWS